MTAVQTFATRSPEETARLAGRLAGGLQRGDALLLEGPVGAGKSLFARALIRSVMTAPEDVPSPTYTLVQTYDTAIGEVWHADLYRLTGPEEIEELGLAEAFETAICLVEWADRLGPLAPADALRLRLMPDPGDPEARRLVFAWTDSRWSRLLEAL